MLCLKLNKATVNPLLSPPGAYLFQACLTGEGLFERGAYLAKRITGSKKNEGRNRPELRFPNCCFGPKTMTV